jgi:hypothetical protein
MAAWADTRTLVASEIDVCGVRARIRAMQTVNTAAALMIFKGVLQMPTRKMKMYFRTRSGERTVISER